MESGALAWSRSPSKVVMDATRLVRPEGSAMMRVADADGAGGDLAGEAAVVLVGADDALDGQAEGLRWRFVGPDGHGLRDARAAWGRCTRACGCCARRRCRHRAR